MPTRRQLLASTGPLLGSAVLAGCTSDDGDGTGGEDSSGDDVPADADVVVGPENGLVFEPEALSVTVGETVTWWFASPDHNVSCDPEHSDAAVLPDGADAFATYDGDDTYATDPEGETFEHTFSTPGDYVYVCVPHGMMGEITVTE